MPKPKATTKDRVCFWLPKPWRLRLLALVGAKDGRAQGEFIRTATIKEIQSEEDRLKK